MSYLCLINGLFILRHDCTIMCSNGITPCILCQHQLIKHSNYLSPANFVYHMSLLWLVIQFRIDASSVFFSYFSWTTLRDYRWILVCSFSNVRSTKQRLLRFCMDLLYTYVFVLASWILLKSNLFLIIIIPPCEKLKESTVTNLMI